MYTSNSLFEENVVNKMKLSNVDSVVSFESFKALKLSNSKSFRALKLSLFESFTVIKF